KFARRIAVTGKGKAILRSIEIEHLASYYFEIAFGATMTAAQVAAVEPDHGRRSHGVDFWICASRWTQSRDTLADASGSIAHSAGVYCAANGQQLSKQLGDFRKRRKRGEL